MFSLFGIIVLALIGAGAAAVSTEIQRKVASKAQTKALEEKRRLTELQAGHKPSAVSGTFIRASRLPYLKANRPCVSIRADVNEFPK